MSKIYAFFGKLMNNNNLLRVLSALIAIVAWFYIINVVDPKTEEEFTKIPVTVLYEGSVPDRNNLMHLMSDTNLTVTVTVSGPRSNLVNLRASDISASLNMDTAISSGSYNLQVQANVNDDQITVVDVYPASFAVEFAKIATRSIPVTVQATGTLPSGYLIKSESISPTRVEIEGPETVVNSIHKAVVTYNRDVLTDDVSMLAQISFVNSLGENVERTFLSISNDQTMLNLSVGYRKTLPLTVTLDNSFGGDESAYITATLSRETVELEGDPAILNSMTEVRLEPTVNTAEIILTDTKTLPLPQYAGATYVDAANSVDVSLKVHDDAQVINVTFTAEEMQNFEFTNVPYGRTPIIRSEEITLRFRSLRYITENFDKTKLKGYIDLQANAENGAYPVYFIMADDIFGGYLNTPTVEIEYEQ